MLSLSVGVVNDVISETENVRKAVANEVEGCGIIKIDQ